MSALEIKIRLARDSDLGAYTRLLQKSFQDTFSDDAIGLPKSFFSEEIFSSERIQGYFSSRIRGGKGKKTWLAFHGADLIGAMTAKKVGREVEFEGFYVDAAFRGGGIGKVLWQRAMDFAGKRNIILVTFSHNDKSNAVYRKLGFVRYGEEMAMHWSEWPEDASAKLFRMRLVQKKG